MNFPSENQRHISFLSWSFLVMVAIDEEGVPVEVPGLILENENERAEWEGGRKRSELRKLRRNEGY